jgi:hypothetical protein
MTNVPILQRGHLVVVPAITLLIAACSENRSSVVENPVPVVEAALVLSDSAPPVDGTLLVSVQAKSNQGVVGSYTARISYDPAGLRFDGEIPLDDKGLRASNPSTGLVRFAGAAAAGFTDGRLASYKFTVLRANSTKGLTLVVDEMHMISRADAKSTLTVAPNRMTSR